MIDMGKLSQSYKNSIDSTPLGVLCTGANEFKNTIISMCRSPESIELFTKTGTPSSTDQAVLELIRINKNAASAYGRNFTRLVQLYEEYNKALTTRGLVADPNKFSTLSTIDAKHIIKLKHPPLQGNEAESANTHNQIIEYGDRMKFLGIIPCFDRGVIHLTHGVSVKWDIAWLNLDNNEMRLKCSAFILGETLGFDYNIPYTDFSFSVHYNTIGDNISHSVIMKDIDVMPMIQMFTAINPKQMRWNKTDRMAWNRVYVRMAKLVDTISAEPAPTASICDLLNDLIFAFLGTNYFLHRNSVSPRPKKNPHEPIIINAFDQEKQDARRVLEVSTNPIDKNTNIIATHEQSNVRCYQVATWGVRGHVRHYKDGKVVYIKPHVKHRRSMGELIYTEKPAPQSINVVEESD